METSAILPQRGEEGVGEWKTVAYYCKGVMRVLTNGIKWHINAKRGGWCWRMEITGILMHMCEKGVGE